MGERVMRVGGRVSQRGWESSSRKVDPDGKEQLDEGHREGAPGGRVAQAEPQSLLCLES